MVDEFEGTQREGEIWELRKRLETAEWVLKTSGFQRCDAAACNCGSWHQVSGFAERFREIKEVVEEAGYSTNGRVLLDAVKQVIFDLERLRKALDAIRSASANGLVCDDVAFIDQIETLHDFCERNLNPVTPADAKDVGSPVLTHEKGPGHE